MERIKSGDPDSTLTLHYYFFWVTNKAYQQGFDFSHTHATHPTPPNPVK